MNTPNTPVFAHRIKINRPWTAGANVADTFKRYGFVPPTEAAQKQVESGKSKD